MEHEVLFRTPGAPMEELASLRSNAFASVDEAVAALVSRSPRGVRIARVPGGPYTYARPVPVLA